ncbi:MAG: 4-hydroxythreonine-4-phosphate dehydrogenase PdxA [Candidatus Poribacteria bacterium]|nr:4-hydroxythreonine-4-phosphate dehydrogenase PdxA [Candidatus Poribacteria bacterium]
MNNHLPTIAITIGDPAGIGPEVVIKALADPDLLNLARWLVIGDGWVLNRVATEMGMEAPDCVIEDVLQRPEDAPVCVLDLRQLEPSQFAVGKLSAACGRAALEYVRTATQLCLDHQADAVVTAPLNKEAVTLTGQEFSGHTEFIAELSGVTESRMLLVNDHLSVIHVSTHCSLRRASELEIPRILHTIQLGHEALQSLGFSHPRIAVCGLNPHAGENGLFGSEDQEFITPAIQSAQKMGIPCEGPFAADTLFLRAIKGAYDLVVAMYHDQGHIPMKLLDFEHTVNVSLGLPIIRTSVDHGTAFDIAGKNQADASSLKAAMKLAVSMSRNR